MCVCGLNEQKHKLALQCHSQRCQPLNENTRLLCVRATFHHLFFAAAHLSHKFRLYMQNAGARLIGKASTLNDTDLYPSAWCAHSINSKPISVAFNSRRALALSLSTPHGLCNVCDLIAFYHFIYTLVITDWLHLVLTGCNPNAFDSFSSEITIASYFRIATDTLSSNWCHVLPDRIRIRNEYARKREREKENPKKNDPII